MCFYYAYVFDVDYESGIYSVLALKNGPSNSHPRVLYLYLIDSLAEHLQRRQNPTFSRAFDWGLPQATAIDKLCEGDNDA